MEGFLQTRSKEGEKRELGEKKTPTEPPSSVGESCFPKVSFLKLLL